MSRRGWTLLASALTLVALVAVAIALPVPYVRLAPGPTFNVIGEVNNQPVIAISGTQTFPTTGTLDMTTVRESGGPRGGLTFVQAIGAWFSQSDAVVPQELLYPEDTTGEEIKERQARLFTVSESNAIAAALNHLGLPVNRQVVTAGVFTDTPADGVLEPGDVIESIDGAAVESSSQVGELVRAAPIGTTFEVVVSRDGSQETLSLASAENPEDAGVAYIGISVAETFTGEFDIDLTLEDIGGPSAGMVFAIGIVDKLTAEDLLAGRAVAGSGTVNPEGVVGGVGGIRQKLIAGKSAGAELFLLPQAQCAQAEGFIPDGLTAVPVENLSEAIDVIRGWTAGQSVPRCPVSAPAGS